MRKTYTNDEIIILLQQCYKENGDSLSIKLYRQKKYKPSDITIRKKFGSWNAALDAAGIPINKSVKKWYSKEDIIKLLQGIAKKDEIINAKSYQMNFTSPSFDTIVSLFGSWNNALEAAGLRENRILIEKEELINSIQTFAQTFPLDISIERYKKEEWQPSVDTIYRKFGSWMNALKIAKVSIRYKTYNEEEILEQLRQTAKKVNSLPLTIPLYESVTKLPHPQTIIRRFGSWEKALEKAGISNTQNSGTPTESEAPGTEINRQGSEQ